jgi:NTE family protein
LDGHIQAHVPPGALQQIDLFHDIPLEELEYLAGRLRLQYAPRGTVLWREGDPADALYILKSGQLKVQRTTGGELAMVATLGPGASFGETSLLTGEPHSHTMAVSIDATLWVLNKDDFDSVLQSHPSIALNLNRTLARRLRHATPGVDYTATREPRRLIGVLGDLDATLSIARRVAGMSASPVLLVEAIDTGDENSTVDPSEPFHDIEPVSGGIDRLGVGIELSSGDFSEIVSHLLTRYDYLFVQLPSTGGHRFAEALELCDVIIDQGKSLANSPLMERIPPEKLWLVGGLRASGQHDRGRAERDMDRLARRLCGMRVGLALSSGGAHGLAHIGVLWVLEREKIPVDLISGTSMGAIIGGAYAAGRRGRALYRAGQEAGRWVTVGGGWRYWDLTVPRSGAIRGNIIKRRLDHWVKGMRFEDLEIPAFIAAAEVVSGRGVIFNSGSLADAIRASISVPLFFEPVPYGNDYLIDGAAADPVPCGCLAEAGADIIIACNVIPQVADRMYRAVRQRVGPGRPPRMLDVSQSEREIMSAQVAVLKMQPYDVLIQPKVGMYSWMESQHIDEFVRRGAQAAEAALPRIKALLSPGARKARRMTA